MNKLLGLMICTVSLAACLSNDQEESFKVNHWSIDEPMVELAQPIRVLHIADIHHDGTEQGKVVLEEIFGRALELSPDLITLGGDYTGLDGLDTEAVRPFIVRQLDRLALTAPTYLILGNHEHWTEADAWLREFRNSDLQVIEGRSELMRVKGHNVCIRGTGDAFTGNLKQVTFSTDCLGVNITVTHDPLGVQSASERGVYLASHTHCSQIDLPLIPAFWTPTDASEDYWCGYGAFGNKQWITSAGVGISVIPIRIGTQAAIELVEIY